jgi:hypothetical protein
MMVIDGHQYNGKEYYNIVTVKELAFFDIFVEIDTLEIILAKLY